MHKEGTQVHTPHGMGTITEVDKVRGFTQYRIAGRGFSVWMDATKVHAAGLESTVDPGHPYHVNDDNSTVLPYDPSPQYHVDNFRHEQTILPGDYEIDPDERLRSSDSLNKNKQSPNRPYPGPNPDLFAKSAGFGEHGWEDDEHDRRPIFPEYLDKPEIEDTLEAMSHDHANGGRFKWSAFEETNPERSEWGDDEWHKDLPDVERTFDARMHEDPMHPQYGTGSPGLAHPPELEYDDPGNPDSIATLRRQEGTQYHPGEGRHFRPAGLSDRYAHIIEADDHSEVGQFRSDPLGYLQRHAHVIGFGDDEHLMQKFADYTNLLDSDSSMRTAAWKDVAAKAKRLRAEGAVHPQDIGPNRILAKVDGDNGQYTTLVLRGPGYAGIGKGANSATYSCTCDWGKWAFKRQFTFVGRMCSHALASLWELQSHAAKGNQGKFKSASIVDDFKKWAKENNDEHMDMGSMEDFLNTTHGNVSRDEVAQLYSYLNNNYQEAPERNYDIPYTLDNEKAYKTSAEVDVAVLRTRPESLTPDMRTVPKNDENEWTDVTEDDRETTGPGQILHFSYVEALHRTADLPPGVDPSSVSESDLNAHPDWKSSVQPSAPGPFGNSVSHEPSSPTQTAYDQQHPGGSPVSQRGGPGIFPPNSALGELFSGHPGVLPSPAGAGPIDPGKGLTRDPSGIHTPGGGGVTFPNPIQALHPQGTPADTAGATTPKPVPAPTAPSQDPRGTGTGLSTPNDPNGVPNTPGASKPTDPNNPSAITQGQSYKVQQGDTLSDIAGRAGLGKDQYQQIADANKDLIKDPNHIETGWDIKIPGQSGTTPPGGQAGDVRGQSGQGGAADASTPPSASPPAGASTPSMEGLGAGLSGGGAGTPTGIGTAGSGKGTNGLAENAQAANAPIDNTERSGRRRTRRRYAEEQEKYRPDTGEVGSDLDKLRNLSDDDFHPQHMDSYNDDVRDVVEELRDGGVDASPIVARLHQAAEDDGEDPADANANFAGASAPDWADEPFAGSGPSPRRYISDSQSYLDAHEPDLHDLTDLGDDDIIKFNDSRSRPEQGPRHKNSTTVKRSGGGPRRAPRVDPGARGQRSTLRHADGVSPGNEDMTALSEPDNEPDALANDIVANFQRSAAAADLMSSSPSRGGGRFSDDDIAAHAQSMLRTAGRKFTLAEQRELEEEEHHLGARNIPNEDDLAGTHYLMGL